MKSHTQTWTCLYFLLVCHSWSFLSGSLPHMEHTQDLQLPCVHLVGSLNPSWRKTSTQAALRSRRRYDCHHKFRTIKHLFLTVKSELPERLWFVPLPEAVVFVCVYVTMCQLCSELCIYGGGSHLDSAKCHDTRLRLLVANLAIYSICTIIIVTIRYNA